jgi:hypothetical protein
MATKYIVNNFSGQTINGDLSINGNLSINGLTNDTGTYKALLTQTGEIIGTSIEDFNFGLIIGETYTITNYQVGDDFSNISNIISGTVNTTGCEFIATGETPSNWSNGSELTSLGDIVVSLLENTLGYELSWVTGTTFSDGLYVAFNSDKGPCINSFPRNITTIKTQAKFPFNWFIFGSVPPQVTTFVGSLTDKDDLVGLYVWDFYTENGVNNSLYYTPVEINQKLVKISYTYGTSFPRTLDFYFSIVCDEIILDEFGLGYLTINNITELINLLNTDNNTKALGTFTQGNNYNEIILVMPESTKNSYCPNGKLTFLVFGVA